MRTSKLDVNSSLKKQLYDSFFQTILDLKDIKEIQVFLNDFFNGSELETFAKRLAVAYWLKKGRSYQNIKENLKVSSATISSVQRQMSTAGFRLALKKMEAEEWANLWSDRIKSLVKK